MTRHIDLNKLKISSHREEQNRIRRDELLYSIVIVSAALAGASVVVSLFLFALYYTLSFIGRII